jgi:transposase-like protein
MAKPVLNEPQFLTEAGAFAYVEARLWPNGPVCPHCGETARIGRLNGKTTRPGLHKCYACKKPFTVRMGTLFEDSHLPLHLWLQVIHLFCCSKKGIATRQIQRMLNCSMKTAWFLGHRIRLAMDPGAATRIGGEGKTVEVDETAISNSPKTKRGPGRKRPHTNVLSLIDRTGPIRSMVIDHRGIGPRVIWISAAAWSATVLRFIASPVLLATARLTIPSLSGRAMTFTPTRLKAFSVYSSAA